MLILQRGRLERLAIAELRRDSSSLKKELIAANLTPTDSEATRPWQVNAQHRAEMRRINDTRTAILNVFGAFADFCLLKEQI
jgi:hypothetical protein